MRTPQARRSHDRADRRARARVVAVAALAGLVLVGSLSYYWWSRQQDPSRDGAPSWYPDSSQLVFAAEVGTAAADIYRMALDGGSRRRLTDHTANDSAPAVSPDGTRIAFESDRDGNAEVYVMNADGSNVVRLTNDPARDQAPAWSPDGRRLAFTSNRDNRASADVYIMQVDGSGLDRVTNDLANWAPQFSPDGRHLAVQVNQDLHVISLDDRSRRVLTAGRDNGMNPTWAPDGQRLAFVTTRNGRSEIFTMNADGTDQKVLVSMPAGWVIDPRWSPDGARIAFVLVPEAVPGPGGALPDEAAPAIYTVEVTSGVVSRVSR
jgi:Tol biopolymer transport system component